MFSLLKFEYNEAVNIETENPGVLEVPEGKNVEDLPIKHFVDIANRKGLSTVTRALNNLQVWNKNKNKELSKWAGDMIDKVSKRSENQQKNESLVKEDYNGDLRDFADKSVEELKRLARKYGFFLYSDYGIKNDYVDRHWIPTIRFDFAEKKSDGDLDKFEKAIRRYLGEFGYRYYIVEPAKVGSYTLYIYGGRDMYNESVDNSVTLDLVEEKELAEFIDWLNEVNIPVAKVNRKFKNITLKNRDDLDEASFYLQDRDYFKKLHDFGWVVSVRA